MPRAATTPSPTLRAAIAGSLLLAACVPASPPPPPPPPPAVPAITGSATELQRVVESVHDTYHPRVSKDGRYLLAHRRDDTKFGDERFTIVRTTIGSPGSTLVSEGHANAPAWFPDGRNFVYESTKTGSNRLVRSSSAGSGAGLTFITNSISENDERYPDVSPDGRKIAFATQLRGVWTIATVNADGSEFTVYTEGIMPRWSPDGRRIAFQRGVGTSIQVFVLNLDSGGQLSQLTSAEHSSYMPAWSPDGEWLTFMSDRVDGRHVWVMRADGSQQTQLTTGRTSQNHPTFGPDGRIYFASDAGGTWDIWRLTPLHEAM